MRRWFDSNRAYMITPESRDLENLGMLRIEPVDVERTIANLRLIQEHHKYFGPVHLLYNKIDILIEEFALEREASRKGMGMGIPDQ